MNIVSQNPSHEVHGLTISQDAKGLDAFLNPSSAASIWRRDMPEGVQAWLTALPSENLPTGRVVMPIKSARTIATELFDMAHTPASAARDWLLNDLADLAQTFGRLIATT